MKHIASTHPFVIACLMVAFLSWPAVSQQAEFIKTVQSLAKQSGFKTVDVDVDKLTILVPIEGGKTVRLGVGLFLNEVDNTWYAIFAAIPAIALSDYSEEAQGKIIVGLASTNSMYFIGGWGYESTNGVLLFMQKYFSEQLQKMSVTQFKQVCRMLAGVCEIVQSNVSELLAMSEGLGIASGEDGQGDQRLRGLLKEYMKREGK